MFRMKQTQMYICTLEEFILVDVVTLLYKWNEILNGIYIGLQWQIQGWMSQACTPLLPKVFSISCSFWGKLTKSYVGTPQRVGTPSYRESWIHPWFIYKHLNILENIWEWLSDVLKWIGWDSSWTIHDMTWHFSTYRITIVWETVKLRSKMCEMSFWCLLHT